MSTDRLLDVFVGVNVAPGTIEATENALREATDRIRGMFGSLQNQSVAAAQNAVNAINNAGRSAGGSAAGGGRGGRGSSGGPLARDFEEARRLAQDLQQELTVVARIIRSTGAEDLTAQLQQMADFLKTTTTQIGRQRTDRDVLGVQDSIARLNDFRQQLRALENTGAVTLNLRQQFDAAAEAARRAVSDERIRNRLAESLIRGTPSGDTRKQLLETRAILDDLEEQIKRNTASFDGTADSVNRLVSSTSRFRDAAQGLSEIQAQAKAAGPSFNTLTNNAYQLGQAIEDFSVGYSLNGLTGGIRGAANNVAFLLNNIVQADFIQGKLNEKWKNLLPVVFGVGSGLLIIGPELISWLATLDDIDQKFQDIARSVDRISKDQQLTANLDKSTESIREFARNATDVTDVVKKVIELRSSVLSLEDEIIGTSRALSQGGVFQSFTNDVEKFDAQIRKVVQTYKDQIGILRNDVGELVANGQILSEDDPLRRAIEARQRERNSPGLLGIGFTQQSEADIKRVEEQAAAVDGLSEKLQTARKALISLQEDSTDGIIADESLTAARDALRQLQDVSVQLSDETSILAEAMDVTKPTAESFAKTVDTLSGSLEDLSSKSKEAKRAQEDMADAITFSKNAMARLLEDSRLELNVLEGSAPEAAKLARELQRAAEQQQKAAANIQSYTKLEVNPLPQADADRLIAASKENLALENRKTLTEEIISAKDKLKQREEALAALNASSLRDEKARTTTLTQYATDIQANVLSTTGAQDAAEKKRLDAIRKEVLAIQELNDAIAYRNELYNVSTDPEQLRRLSNRRADRFSVEPVGAFKGQDYARAWMEPILRQMVLEQSSTKTEVIRKDTTPRAQ